MYLGENSTTSAFESAGRAAASEDATEGRHLKGTLAASESLATHKVIISHPMVKRWENLEAGPEAFNKPAEVAAQERLHSVAVPNLQTLKRQTEFIQKTCSKLKNDLKKVSVKYRKNIKRLQSLQTKERRRMAVEYKNTLPRQDKLLGWSTLLKALQTRSNKPLLAADLDRWSEVQKTQWWDLLQRQADTMATLETEYCKSQLNIELPYHEQVY